MVAFKGVKGDKGTELASAMARAWSDGAIMMKKPEDLMVAYGIAQDQARKILQNERRKRGMNND